MTAFASNANTTLIFAVQTICLFAMVLVAPAAVGWLSIDRQRHTPSPPNGMRATDVADGGEG